MIRVDQHGVQGGHAVAEKRVDMAYNALGQFTEIIRYKALAGPPADEVATSVFTYDAGHRLVGLSHNRGGQALFTPYSWTYDPLDRIVQMVHADGTSSYSYDQTDQLVGADHSYQPDEAYQFDLNGNRTGGGYVVGANNQLLEDGSYRYEYDAEGNRTVKENITTGERQEYTWDHRNRLVQIQVRDAQGTLVRDIQYVYDVFDRRIAKTVDPDGAGPAEVVVSRYVLDNPSVVTGAADPALVGADHIVLEFAGGQPATLRHRYLYGPVVDQVFAREDVESLWQPGEVLWPLGDHLGTVRDILDSAGNVVNHLRYDSFGRITSETNAAVDFLFAFTGRERDEESGLYYYRARYYDPSAGRFISEDPLGFAAGDANLSRYVGNSPSDYFDPTGQTTAPLSRLRSAMVPSRRPIVRQISEDHVCLNRLQYFFAISSRRVVIKNVDTSSLSRWLHSVAVTAADHSEGTSPTGQDIIAFASRGNNKLPRKGNNKLPAVTELIAEAQSIALVESKKPDLNYSGVDVVRSAPDFLKLLQRQAAKGKVFVYINVKGHGFQELHGSWFGGVHDSQGQFFFHITTNKRILVSTGPNESVDVTDLLKRHTNANTCIYLNGCHTDKIAREMAQILGNGTTVYGNWGYAVGIPYSGGTIARWVGYSFTEP